jgi:hypothetical protein
MEESISNDNSWISSSTNIPWGGQHNKVLTSQLSAQNLTAQWDVQTFLAFRYYSARGIKPCRDVFCASTYVHQPRLSSAFFCSIKLFESSSFRAFFLDLSFRRIRLQVDPYHPRWYLTNLIFYHFLMRSSVIHHLPRLFISFESICIVIFPHQTYTASAFDEVFPQVDFCLQEIFLVILSKLWRQRWEITGSLCSNGRVDSSEVSPPDSRGELC